MLGTGSFGQICQAVEDVMHDGKPLYFGDKSGPIEEIGRVVTTGPGWAYRASPRGATTGARSAPSRHPRPLRSRTLDAIVQEAKDLADLGVKELIVIAQDITRWGMDLYGRPSLARLLRELAKIDGIRWIRLHYLYPEIIDDELIDLIANEDKIVKYLDIPIQHINNDILRRMNRHCTGDEIRALLQKLRARIPGLVLRTSLITGLPGEGEAEFEELCTWLREVRLERVGVFPFSPEEGTPAAVMTDRCEPDEAQRRADLILELQAGIMDDYNAACIGRDMTVLCEHRARSGMCSGRTYADSPEIDGTVYFTGTARPGDMVTVHITGCDDGDLAGEQIHE
ncbi:MAG: MiaB/RimO family radical SAM methylthiotransferase [Oscillospiraceae bacterium]